MQHEVITGKIIGCAMKVHNVLGCGFQEVIYQRALAIEMEKQRLIFVKEMQMTIFMIILTLVKEGLISLSKIK